MIHSALRSKINFIEHVLKKSPTNDLRCQIYFCYLGSDETRECKSGELASVDPILIHMTDIDLDCCMVLCGDEPIRRGAAIIKILHSNLKKINKHNDQRNKNIATRPKTIDIYHFLGT